MLTPTCCSLFRAKQAQDTENWSTNTRNRMIIYWNRFRKEPLQDRFMENSEFSYS